VLLSPRRYGKMQAAFSPMRRWRFGFCRKGRGLIPEYDRSRSMKIAFVAFLALSLCGSASSWAGSGRQSDTIEVDYEYPVVCRWLEHNEEAIEESTGARVIRTAGDVITLQKETKHGLQVFRVKRTGTRGNYRASFVDRSVGELTDYNYRIKLSPISNGRTQIEITMSATAEQAYSVSVNVELRRSIRGLRAFLQDHLNRPVQ
jgi:hypothetical protein